MNIKEVYTLTSGNKAEVSGLNYGNELSKKLSANLKCLYPSIEYERYAKFAFGAGMATSDLYKEFQSKYEYEHLAKLREAESLYDKIKSDNSEFIHDVGNVNDIINYYGKFSDLIIAPSNIEDNNEEYSGIIHSLIFETGSPTILIPTNYKYFKLDKVVVCWDGSIRASRALRNSTDLLKLGKEIIILGVNESEKDINSIDQLKEYLSSHDLEAKHLGIKKANHSIGKTILEESEKQDADLVIMGAYTHNKLRQAILGGVTKHMLKHHKMPVLMMH